MAQSKSSNGRTIGIITLVIGGAAITGYLAWKYILVPSAAKPTAGAGKTTATPPPPSYTVTNSGGGGNTSSGSGYASGFPLKIGSSGANVKTLQGALNDLGSSLTVDGQFGVNTQNALIAQTGLATVDSPSDLQSLVNSGNTKASTYNYKGSMLCGQNAMCCTMKCYTNNPPAPTPPPASCNFLSSLLHL